MGITPSSELTYGSDLSTRVSNFPLSRGGNISTRDSMYYMVDLQPTIGNTEARKNFRARHYMIGETISVDGTPDALGSVWYLGKRLYDELPVMDIGI